MCMGVCWALFLKQIENDIECFEHLLPFCSMTFTVMVSYVIVNAILSCRHSLGIVNEF